MVAKEGNFVICVKGSRNTVKHAQPDLLLSISLIANESAIAAFTISFTDCVGNDCKEVRMLGHGKEKYNWAALLLCLSCWTEHRLTYSHILWYKVT